MISKIYDLFSDVRLINNIKYYWSYTSSLLYYLPKKLGCLLLRLSCYIDLIRVFQMEKMFISETIRDQDASVEHIIKKI